MKGRKKILVTCDTSARMEGTCKVRLCFVGMSGCLRTGIPALGGDEQS